MYIAKCTVYMCIVLGQRIYVYSLCKVNTVCTLYRTVYSVQCTVYIVKRICKPVFLFVII